MNESVFHFGIDTSNYTTSVAAVNSAGEVFSAKRHLEVPLGNKGVRQSDALFCHTRDLPEITGETVRKIREKYPDFSVKSIGVSTSPRREKGSYMPCFLAGINAAKCAAAIFGTPLYEFSHQEGHLKAAIFGLSKTPRPFPQCDEFYAFHLSGGTSELLEVKADKYGFTTKIIASGNDITCGQFIDRCGVKLGMKFPCGKELDELSLSSDEKFNVKIAKKENGINLSGFENKFDDLMKKTEDKKTLAKFVFCVVEKAIYELLSFIPDKNKPVLVSGGVSSSEYLKRKFDNGNIYFAPNGFSDDNAIGTAVLSMSKDEING